MALKPAIVLVETRAGCAMFEKQSRYDVIFNGQRFDVLYFNMTGYRGVLPTPGGASLDIGEKSIAAFKKEVAALNREFADAACEIQVRQ